MTTTTRAATGEPVRLALPGRTLLLVAGMPGAGKSTLLATLPPAPGVVIVDSETHRAALRRLLGRIAGRVAGRVRGRALPPYAVYRPLVHLLHRLTALRATFSTASTVVVHLPATDPGMRSAVARLAVLSGREAHLLWLHVDPADARRGQSARGRVVPEGSMAGHAQRAEASTAALRSCRPAGWRSVTVLDRQTAASGLLLETGAPDPDGSRAFPSRGVRADRRHK